MQTSRDFVRGLKKWSHAVMVGIVAGKALSPDQAEAAWLNHRGNCVNGGAGWVNAARRGGTGGWVSAAGGGDGTWVNRRGC